jgi:hypothetical protein
MSLRYFIYFFVSSLKFQVLEHRLKKLYKFLNSFMNLIQHKVILIFPYMTYMFFVSSLKFQVCNTKFHEVLHKVPQSFLIWIVLKELHRGVLLSVRLIPTSNFQHPSFNRIVHQNVPSICLVLSLLVQ